MSGLFDTFNIAKRGLNVQQSAINTTSHNIANANTVGYSRQRAVSETTKPFGGMSKFDSCSVGQVGTGAEITSIQRIRDSFIDFQVRSESGTSGYYTTKSDTLSQVEDIYGEPSDTGIQELISKFYSAFQEVSKSPDKSDVKTVAIKQASALADQINYTYNQLQKTNANIQNVVLKTNVTDVNSYLDQINELNKQISGISAVGQTPNDLLDKRDNLLDELSYKFGIKIDKKSYDTIDLSSTEYPDNALVKSDPNDINYNRFSYVKSATAVKDATGALTGDVTVEYYPLGKENAVTKSFTVNAAAVGDTDIAKKTQDVIDNISQNRILLADKDGTATIEKTSTNGKANATINIGSGVGVNTDADATGGLTITFDDGATPTPATTATITRTSAGVITVSPSTSTYVATNNSDGTMNIKLNSNVTIKIGKDGSITVPADSLKGTSTAEAEKITFKTYEYEGGVNNVDNNNIKGDIAGNQSVQADIQGYMDDLDTLAAALAYSVNSILTGSIDDGSVDGTATSQGLNNNLLFVSYNETTKTNNTTDTGVTAKNIRINSDLLADSGKLNCNTTSISGVGDGKRAAAIANISTFKMNLSNIGSSDDLSTMDRKAFLTTVGIDTTTTGFSDTTCLSLNPAKEGSTLDSYYKTVVNNLAVANQEATRVANNQETKLANLEDQKAAVSGVSLDEEMTNLIQFQHAYQANAKMISTLDELLDVVINGLKR